MAPPVWHWLRPRQHRLQLHAPRARSQVRSLNPPRKTLLHTPGCAPLVRMGCLAAMPVHLGLSLQAMMRRLGTGALS